MASEVLPPADSPSRHVAAPTSARPLLASSRPWALAALAGLGVYLAVGRGEPNLAAGIVGMALFATMSRRASPGRGALLGALAGVVTWLPSGSFTFTGAMNAGASAPIAALAFLLVVGIHAARFAAAAWLAKRLESSGVALGIATALGWVAAEALDPAIAPWSLGAATLEHPFLSAAADLGGPPLAALVVALGGGLVAELIHGVATRATQATFRKPWVALGMATLVVAAVRGKLASWGIDELIETAPRVRVAAIHTERRRGEPVVSAPSIRSRVVAASREADVVVLPEATFAFTSAETAAAALQAIFEGVSPDVLVGVTFGPRLANVNAIARVSPSAPEVEWYVKTRPFPVGEERSWLAAVGIDAPAGALSAGDVVASLVFRRARNGGRDRGGRDGADAAVASVAPAICWEDLFADAGHRAASAGPSWIASAVNDGWFEGTSAGRQHLLHARLRAVEARRAVVRSTNLGETAIIDAEGRVTARRTGKSYVAASIPLLGVQTFAVRTRGALSLWIAGVVVAGAITPRATRARIRPQGS